MREFGKRMKAYEKGNDIRVTKKVPVVLWMDGRAFHTFTRGLTKPFDRVLNHTMVQTMQDLVDNIQNAKIAYTQSDEIAVILTDTDQPQTSAWFDYRVQKMVSIGASMATQYFNKHWYENVHDDDWGRKEYDIDEDTREWTGYWHDKKRAMFDCRVFNLPEYEVENWLLFRQTDWMRNSVQMFARSLYSHNELQGKNTKQLRQMCREKGKYWNYLEPHWKYGTFATKTAKLISPSFKVAENREYIREVIGVDKHEWEK